MTDDLRTRPIVPYATRDVPQPPSVSLLLLAIGAWACAAGVALVSVLAFIATGREEWAGLGALWLLGGGVVTLIGVISGTMYASRAREAGYPSPHTRRRAKLAVLLPSSNVLLAAACVVGGVWLVAHVSSRFTLRLSNASTLKLDSVSVRLSDGSLVAFGPMGPGAATSRSIALIGDGSLTLVLRSGDKQWEQLIGDWMDEDDVREDLNVSINPPSSE